MITHRILLLIAALAFTFPAMAVPGLINYSGRLTGSGGAPIIAAKQVTFTFWDAATGGNQLGGAYDYQTQVNPNTDGLYSVAIGEGEPIPGVIFDSPGVWLNVNVEGENLFPRARITSVGYAFQADSALALKGAAYVMAKAAGTTVENGQSLLAAYTEAKALTPNGMPLSAGNRAVVLVPPGRYNLTTKSLVLDTEFVDIVGLSTARENQYITGASNGPATGVIRQTANNVRVENLMVVCTNTTPNPSPTGPKASDQAAYFPDSDLPLTVIRNCEFKRSNIQALAMRVGIEYSGMYIDCAGGVKGAFGGYGGTASGSFIRCKGGGDAFGGRGTATGTFIHCTGGHDAFGGYGTASGTFTNCTGMKGAFGSGDPLGNLGTASGTFTNCTGDAGAFGGFLGGTASGTFTNCTGGTDAFGGGGGDASGGIFRYCTGGLGSFSSAGTPVPIHLYCIEDNASYP